MDVLLHRQQGEDTPEDARRETSSPDSLSLPVQVEQLSGSQVLLLTDDNSNQQDLEIEADEDLEEPEEETVDIDNITFEEDSDELEDALEVIDELEEALEVNDELEAALEVIDELEEALEVIDELEEALEVIDAAVTKDIDGKESLEQTDIEEEIIIEVPKEDVVDWVDLLVEEDGIININKEVEDLEDTLDKVEANEGEEKLAVVLLGEEDTRDTKEEVAEEPLPEEEEEKPIAEIKDLEKYKDIEDVEDTTASEVLCIEVEEKLEAPAPKRSFLGKFRGLFSKKQ